MTTAARPVDSAYAPPADATTPAVAGTPAPTHCLDCATPLVGHYCHECGARRAEERPLTVARFGHELVHEVSNVDSNTVRTLRSLFGRPGEMTRDYLAGRARRYLSPLRLYVLLFGVMIAFSNGTGITARIEANARAQLSPEQLANFERLSRKAGGTATAAGGAKRDYGAEITHAIFTYSFNPWLRLLDPLVIAVVLGMLFRARRQSYPQHVVFALHVLAFNATLTLATLTLHWAVGWRQPWDTGVTLVHWTVLGAYFFTAARVVHEETKVRVGVKTLAFLAGAQAAMLLVPMLVAMIATVYALVR